jgi:hypothetical protein
METACPRAESNVLQVRDLPSYLDREHLVPFRQIIHEPIKELTTVRFCFTDASARGTPTASET